MCLWGFGRGLYRSSRAGVPLGYESQKLCIWIISSAQRASTLGPPRKAAHVPKNPKSLWILHLHELLACLYAVAVVIAGNKLWQTHNITEGEGTAKMTLLFVSHTVKCTHTLMATQPANVFAHEVQKKWFYHSHFSAEQCVTDGQRITGAVEDETRIKRNFQLSE